MCASRGSNGWFRCLAGPRVVGLPGWGGRVARVRALEGGVALWLDEAGIGPVCAWLVGPLRRVNLSPLAAAASPVSPLQGGHRPLSALCCPSRRMHVLACRR